VVNILNKWKERIAQYIEVRFRLFKLGIIEFVSSVLSYFIFSMLSLFLLFVILLFMGFGLAEAYSEWLQSRAGGYFLAGATFLILSGIVVLLRKYVLKSLSGLFIRILTNNGDEDDRDEEENMEYDRDIPVR
jgi:hypothetical protein